VIKLDPIGIRRGKGHLLFAERGRQTAIPTFCVHPPTANYNCDFRDEAADSGDQRNLPIDLGRQMSFHVCKSTFMSEPISELIRLIPPLR